MLNASIAAMSRIECTDPAGSVQQPQRPRSSGRLPDINTHRCTGCGRCVAACELHLLSLEAARWEKFAVLHEPDRCTSCSVCVVTCPFRAITMRKQSATAAPTVAFCLDSPSAGTMMLAKSRGAR
jgi:ferredoxin